MEEKKTTKKTARKKAAPKKVDPKLLLSEKIDSLVSETAKNKNDNRSEIDTASHAILNKAIFDLGIISKLLKR